MKYEKNIISSRIKNALVVGVFGVLLFEIGKMSQVTRQVHVKHFTAFFDTEGQRLEEENEIKEQIAQKIHAECDESWANGMSRRLSIHSFISSGEYPDFISGGMELYQAGALIPIDTYWDEYPNLYHYLTPQEWDQLRLPDGHIYWIPQFGVSKGKIVENIHDGEAFWIQTRVLKWANYPKICSLEEYFDLIERYVKANPVMENGTPNIPFSILCDDWRYFCLENVPQFLAGYPNDGSCMVDPETLQVIDYNTCDVAKQYFQKLNEEYHKGILDPEAFTATYEEYLDKLSSGAVLGMVDQWWEFAYDIGIAYAKQNLSAYGCGYVPLPITIDGKRKNQWHVSKSSQLNSSSGLSITVSCKDVQGALKFINDLLDPEIQTMRYWGEEGVDYMVDQSGRFYMDHIMEQRRNNAELKKTHYCFYSYFPRNEGLIDEINGFSPEYQPGDYLHSVAPTTQECLRAYGCKNYVDMLGNNPAPGKWFPMYTYSSQLTYGTPVGDTWEAMTEVKQNWLPQVIMDDDFESTWNDYMKAYESCRPEIFFEDMQKELERRVKGKP